MVIRTVVGWILFAFLRHPLGPWVACGALAWTPLLARLGPLDVRSAGPRAWEIAGTWAFPLGLLGVVWALSVLQRGRGFLERLAPTRAVAGGVASCAALALLLQTLLASGAWLTGALEGRPPTLEPWTVGALVLADLHLAAWATLLLRLEMEGMTRLVFFWGIGIVFPVLSAAGTLGVPGRLLQPLTDASLHLGTAATRAPSALFLGAAPVAALLLANVLPTRWFRT